MVSFFFFSYSNFFIALEGFLIAATVFFAFTFVFLIGDLEILGIYIILSGGVYSAIITCQVWLIHINLDTIKQ